MAIITEHDEDHIDPPSKPQPRLRSKSKPKPEPEPEPTKPNSQQQQQQQQEQGSSSGSSKTQNSNPFTFWFYFTLTVSLFTLLFVSLSSSLAPHDPKSWFLSLPSSLRAHYSNGRPIKVQLTSNEPPIEVFTYSKGSRGSEHVLIVHGLGCSSFTFGKVVDELGAKGVFAVAVDLPGSGFSDKTVVRERERVGGGLGRFWEVYEEIKEKGIFWGFDHLVEHGYVPFDEIGKSRVSTRKDKVVEPLELGGGELGRVLGQVVDSLGIGPLHLVLHDSALVMGANWVLENAGLLRSLTLIDTLPGGTVLPLWALEVPVVREVVLGVGYVFEKLIESCCSKVSDGSSVDAHRILLKGRDGRKAVVGMGKRLNQSFDLGAWAATEGIKGLPLQVVWASGWSEEWNEQGRRVAELVSQAKLVKHSGGRWPQDDTSSIEVAEIIASFVSSLPKTQRKADEQPLPEHIQKMFDEAKTGDNHHHDDHHHHHHHGHGGHADYMDAYGLGHGQHGHGHGHGHGWGM